MQSSIARRAVVIGAASALALVGPPTASAEPVPALPSQLVDALSRDLNLRPDAYLARADLSHSLSEFAQRARVEFPQSFAGVRVDPSGIGTVGVANGPDSAALRAEAADAGFVDAPAGRSEQALRQEASTLDSLLAAAPPPIADAVRGISIDPATDGLRLRLADTAAGVPLPPFLDAVRVLFVPSGADPAPVPVAADSAALGGDAYTAMSGSVGLTCSLGFNGIDAAGNAVNVSAGHCDPNLAAAGTDTASVAQWPGGVRFGSFEKSTLTDHDYSIIRIDDSARDRFSDNSVRVPGAAPVDISGTSDPVVGAPVCKSGSRTGFTCGTIDAVDQTVEVGARTLVDGFSTDICALEGDSGGTLVSGTRAVGISSASNVGQYGLCQLADAVTFVSGDTPELFATPINRILADNPGLSIRTS